MIDVQGLTALVAVARQGSVVAAAETLGYTPSAVSQQVKKLERDLGAALLERHGRGVLLTERGRALALDAGPTLDGLRRLEQFGMSSAAPVRIASFSTATRGLLGPVLDAMRDGDGRPRATVTSLDPVDAMELTANGSVDLAVVHNWNSVPLVAPGHVVSEPLCSDEADVVLSSRHPLATRSRLERSDLVGESWASTPRGAICHEALLRIFSDLGAVPHIVAYDPDFASLVELARQNVAICLLPRLGRAPLPAGVVAIPLADRSQVRQVSVVYRRTLSDSPAVREAVALLHAEGDRFTD